jgi:hypothetical protein
MGRTRRSSDSRSDILRVKSSWVKSGRKSSASKSLAPKSKTVHALALDLVALRSETQNLERDQTPM